MVGSGSRQRIGDAVGLDVGGSKTHLRSDSGVDQIVNSAPWHRRGMRGVADGVLALVEQSLRETPSTVVVGAHGCDSRDQCVRLANLMRARLDATVLVVNDAELLLPAARMPRGVGLVAGTGSTVVGYDPAGGLLIAGGWGGYIGDEASATGLLRDAARAVAAAHDRGMSDPLADAIAEALALEELRDLPVALSSFGWPTAWAHLTPHVFDTALAAGSELAQQVIDANAHALIGLAALLHERGADRSVVVAGGGVAANASWMQDALRRALADLCPGTELVIITKPPVAGALALATDLAVLARGQQLEGPVPQAMQAFAAAGRHLERTGGNS